MLSHRRRSLLTLASYGTWDFSQTSFPYVYNSLLPNGSEVVKGKIAKIYANGVIENQIVDHSLIPSSVTRGGLTITYNATTKTIVANNTTTTTYIDLIKDTFSTIAGHKYFYYGVLSNLPGGAEIVISETNATQYRTTGNYAFFTSTTTASNRDIMLYTTSGTVVTNFKLVKPIIKDLTQEFGTGNEPTSILDTRIQRIISNIDTTHNNGSYKGTNVGEIATEPYNLFDGEIEGGSYDSATGLPATSANNYRSKNKIKVIAGETYTLEWATAPTTLMLYYYDANGNYIDYVLNNISASTKTKDYTIPNGCAYINFSHWMSGSGWGTNPPSEETAKICFHITGTRTGFAKHKPNASIPFIYQGNGAINAQDTLEITQTECVFTKNVSNYTFNGSESWSKAEAGQGSFQQNFFYIVLANMNCGANGTRTTICDNANSTKYANAKREDIYGAVVTKAIAIENQNNSLIPYICDSDYSSYTTSQFASAMVGMEIHYQLATPQTITIPRKKLGIVDLGSLSWTYNSNWGGYGAFYCETLNVYIEGFDDNSMPNWYNTKYITKTRNEAYSSSSNSICASGSARNRYITIRDSNYTDATTFKNSLSGIYLFYETAEEVDDIATRIFTEQGGTITTDSEVLPNLDLDLPVKV